MKQHSEKELKNIANTLRKHLIKMLEKAGSGHPGGSMSSVEIITALYFAVMKHDPENPCWEKRDRFILSKGHVCPILYAAMAESGYFPVSELMTLRKLGSRLQGHPHMCKLPGLETSSGSLGQGLSIAVGVAKGFKMDEKKNHVYCLMGDGELNEGQIWEAAMSASQFQLDNLTGIVDVNGLQIDGWTKDVKCLSPLKDKWESFGWYVIEVDGHNVKQIIDALNHAKHIHFKPTVLLCHTIKGKGVSFMEDQAGWHGKAPNEEQTKKALKELERAEV
ncbi:transketolase [Candidatus Woesearchaeota archaeon]|nr:transketolase [Candidatus Woesearchaeota archaeon]